MTHHDESNCRSAYPVRQAVAGRRAVGRGAGDLCSRMGRLAAAIKLEDGGPVFFGQDRVGEGGRIIWRVEIPLDDSERREPRSARCRPRRTTRGSPESAG